MKPQPTTPPSLTAAAHFKKGYNCAQSVLLTMHEHYGNKPNELIPKIASAFGGGIGRCGNLCGALTGAIMAIGLKHGTNELGMEKRETAAAQAQRFYEQFTRQFGTPYCRELIGYDLTDPQQLKEARERKVFDEKCTRFVEKAVDILLCLDE